MAHNSDNITALEALEPRSLCAVWAGSFLPKISDPTPFQLNSFLPFNISSHIMSPNAENSDAPQATDVEEGLAPNEEPPAAAQKQKSVGTRLSTVSKKYDR